MIKIKLFYTYDEIINRYGCEEYTQNTFNYILDRYEDCSGYEGKEAFRDAESMQFIQEVDRAKFTSKYGIETPYGECPVTCLSGGVQYALTCIYNSRLGVYTEYKNYKDILNMLNKMPMEILLYIDLPKIGGDSGELNFALLLDNDITIENYKDVDGVLHENVKFNRTHNSNYFKHLDFDEKRDFERVVVNYARKQMEHTKIFEYPPIVYSSFKELGESIYRKNDIYGNSFRDGINEWSKEEKIACQPSVQFPDVTVCNYLIEEVVPLVKYPRILIVVRDEEAKTYSVGRGSTVKNPSFSELVMCTDYCDDRGNVLQNFGNWNSMILVFDVCSAFIGDSWLENLFMVEKLGDKTISFYSPKRGWHELLKFVGGYTYENE